MVNRQDWNEVRPSAQGSIDFSKINFGREKPGGIRDDAIGGQYRRAAVIYPPDNTHLPQGRFDAGYLSFMEGFLQHQG